MDVKQRPKKLLQAADPEAKGGPGLSIDHALVYRKLVAAVDGRKQQGILPPRVLLITDLANGYDDLAALVVAKELQRLGAITV